MNILEQFPNRTFLQLSHSYKVTKHALNGRFVSEKLDGIRAFWDGGVSRGRLASDVPYANTIKDSRFKEPPVATGLWSRYGKVIHAPESWLESMPTGILLDGELWIGRGQWQATTSIVSKIVPNDEQWSRIHFMIIDSPPEGQVFSDGELIETHFRKRFAGCHEWFKQNALDNRKRMEVVCPFEVALDRLHHWEVENDTVHFIEQQHLSRNTDEAKNQLDEHLNSVIAKGGEGVIIHHRSSFWVPRRAADVLKYKPFHDAEAKVVGFIWGRETDKGSKLLGLMGAMIVEMPNGVQFELSGFSDAERRIVWNREQKFFDNNPATMFDHIAKEQAGKPIDLNLFESQEFPIGSQVTYRYRELSDTGIPKEARYLRKR